MRGNRPAWSLGTVLTVALTAVVVVGCVILFGKIRSGNPDAQMNPQRVISVVADAMLGATPDPGVQATVRTVTVTLAPAPSATAAPKGKATAKANTDDQKRTFRLTIGGSMAFESEISDSVYNKTSKTFNYKPILASLRSKVDGDLNLALLPQVVNNADQKYADALVPDEAIEGITESGFDQLLLNSSHVLDQGIEGVNQTVACLAQQGITCWGVTAGSAKQYGITQLNGAKIAFLAYTETLTAKGKIALESQPRVMQLFDAEQAKKDIASLKNQGADFVIVSMYWGKEDTAGVTSAMRSHATQLAEAGADLIIGHRPKRVLPVESISVPDDNGVQRQCLIAYSMGTLLTESREGYDISGMLLHLTVTCDPAGVHFDTVEYTPTYIWRRSVNGRMQYSVVCSGDEAPSAMDQKQKEVMARALNRIRNTLKNSPVDMRK